MSNGMVKIDGVDVIYDNFDINDGFARDISDIPIVPVAVRKTRDIAHDERFKCELRFCEVDGKRWVYAVDVVKALEYKNPTQYARTSIPNEYKIRLGNSKRGAILLSAAGVSYAIVHSKMPKAKEYRDWVFQEVLPTIHMTGKYDANADTSVKAKSEVVREMDSFVRDSGIEGSDVASEAEQIHESISDNIQFDIDESVLSESARVARNEIKLLFELINNMKHTFNMKAEDCCDFAYKFYGDTLKEMGRKHKKDAFMMAGKAKADISMVGKPLVPNFFGTPREVAEYIMHNTMRSCTVQELNKFLMDVDYQQEVKTGVYEPQDVAIAKYCVARKEGSVTLLWHKDIILDLWKALHPHCMER
mgnify:FL=1